MTTDQLRRETISRLKGALEGAPASHLRDAYSCRSGSVLTNGWDTLRPQWLYVMGHNPGGDEKTDPLICTHIETLASDARGIERGGRSTFYRHVRPIVCAFGELPDDAFVTNALFVRLRGTSDIAADEAAIFDACWPVHEWFLSVVKPRLILCLGYQVDPKRRLPFRLILEKMKVETRSSLEEDGSKFGICVTGQLPLGADVTHPVALAAVYHPSARGKVAWTEARLTSLRRVAHELRGEIS